MSWKMLLWSCFTPFSSMQVQQRDPSVTSWETYGCVSVCICIGITPSSGSGFVEVEADDCVTMVQLAIQKCLENEALCNEFYLQLIKQTTDQPGMKLIIIIMNACLKLKHSLLKIQIVVSTLRTGGSCVWRVEWLFHEIKSFSTISKHTCDAAPLILTAMRVNLHSFQCR